jgi:hypothetical protein
MIEVVVSVAIAATIVAALTSAVVAAAHRFTPQPVQAALDAAVVREMRVAVDLFKYSGTALAPAVVSTSVPVPGASPVAATMSVTATSGGGPVSVTISATSQTSPPVTSSLQTTIAEPAPLPSTLVPAGSGPAPQ